MTLSLLVIILENINALIMGEKIILLEGQRNYMMIDWASARCVVVYLRATNFSINRIIRLSFQKFSCVEM